VQRTEAREIDDISAVANLDGGRAPPPPPLDDGLTPSLTVMLANATFLSPDCKRGTQSIQNDCRQWLSDSFRVHRICFRPGLFPGPRWGSLQRPT